MNARIVAMMLSAALGAEAFDLSNRVRAKHFAKKHEDGVHGNTQYSYQANENVEAEIPDEGDINLYSVRMPENVHGRSIEVNTIKKNSTYDVIGKGGTRMNQRMRPGQTRTRIDVGVTQVSESRRVKKVVNYSENIKVRLKRK